MDVVDALLTGAGFAGAFLTLFAFFQVSHGRWKPKEWPFQVCNAAAAILLIAYGIHTAAYANIALNVAWFTIAAAALLRFGRR